MFKNSTAVWFLMREMTSKRGLMPVMINTIVLSVGKIPCSYREHEGNKRAHEPWK